MPTTDNAGKATVQAALPQLTQTTKPLQAEVVIRMREPSGSSSDVRKRSGSRMSPAKTTDRSCFESRSLLARVRSSLKTGVEGLLRLVDDENGA
ncbi:MAG: hypothetical protein HC850_06505 [Rhodomicrobium sp.]|nr:hypothetical protein [Rhodomicrobium sp.]